MRGTHIVGNKHGDSCLVYKGRKYAISLFEGPSAWAMYKGKEVLITGFHADARGAYGLWLNPHDPYRGLIIPRTELVML